MLSPEEKAKIIFNKYATGISMWADTHNQAVQNVKECALICVDEIIDSRPTQPISERHQETLADQIEDCIEYWDKVKEHLTKM